MVCYLIKLTFSVVLIPIEVDVSGCLPCRLVASEELHFIAAFRMFE